MKYEILSFRIRLAFAIMCAVTIPALSAGWLMIHQTENALLKEKEQKLLSIARELDTILTGTFEERLGSTVEYPNQAAKINRLHALLADSTEQVARSNPGTGVGYYSLDLNAVVTYGPEKEMSDAIGKSIGPDHPGWQVMATGTPLVHTGPQVRGDIMNAMVPLIRNGHVIGYAWANETTASIDMQLYQMEQKLLLLLRLGVLFSIIISFLIAGRVGGAIDRIIHAISRIEADHARLPAEKGMLGKIPASFNKLLDRLAETRAHNRKLEEYMQRTDRLQALGQLAAGMAHEIRNPLTSIKAFAQIMEESMPDQNSGQEYLSIIIEETDRLNQLVEQMLAFGRPAPGQQESINLCEVIHRSLILFEHEFRKKQIVLLQELQPAFLTADPNLLQQAVVNLLLNAIQATPASGTVHVSSGTHDSNVWLSIYNSGTPIPNEYGDMIFNPFFTTKEEGTGLGLAITQHIVHIYGGTIFWKNDKDGVRFRIELPVHVLDNNNGKGEMKNGNYFAGRR